ncbi:MAG: biosynthetic peptidoglycan transglycosylase, partial [Pseudomonadota bacterium]
MKASNGKPGLKKPARKKAAPKAQKARMELFRGRPVLKWGLFSSFVLSLGAALAAWLYWQSLYIGMPSLPETASLWDANREPAIEFVDRNGKTLAIRGPRYGRAISIDELPPHVPRAFIAAEDKRFYEHDGADTQAMARAAWSNVISGKTVSGASTITQQLVKNLVLSPEQTLKRKVQEVRLARELEDFILGQFFLKLAR